MREYTEAELKELIQSASSQGKPGLVMFYQSEIARIRKAQKN